MAKDKKKEPKPHKCKFRKVGTVTKKGVTYIIEACYTCHETRIR